MSTILKGFELPGELQLKGSESNVPVTANRMRNLGNNALYWNNKRHYCRTKMDIRECIREAAKEDYMEVEYHYEMEEPSRNSTFRMKQLAQKLKDYFEGRGFKVTLKLDSNDPQMWFIINISWEEANELGPGEVETHGRRSQDAALLRK